MSSATEHVVRYATAVDPVTTDGRDIDTKMGTLSGEASQQITSIRDPHIAGIAQPAWDQVPGVSDDPTYYDRPMLKESVWTIDIPIYYFLGGTAGAALALGSAAQLVNDPDLRQFSAHCHWMGILGSTLGAGFLIHDLGRPSRFLNMMRVFRPTSPMNVGAWILGGAAPTAIATGLFINRGGLLGVVGEVTGYLSGLFGAALATYTGVLVSNSAIPVWQEARRWMPVLFMASGMSAAAAVLDILHDNRKANRITIVFGTAGCLLELAASHQIERAASTIPQVERPFREGATSYLWKGAAVLTFSSLFLVCIPGRSKTRRRTAGVLGIMGSLMLRFAVHYISDASARDPRASFHHQRSRNKAEQELIRSGSADIEVRS